MTSHVSRIPILSNVVDLFYHSLPAPFFVVGDRLDGELSPDVMMKMVDGRVLVVVCVGLAMALSATAFVHMGLTYTIAAVIPVLVHWILFLLHALPKRSEKYFDLAGQIGFSAMLTFVAVKEDALLLSSASPRKLVACILCFVWSFRLGWFLFTRMLERGDDWRFVEARNKPGFHFFTWTSQGLWCFMQGLSILTLFKSSREMDAMSPFLSNITDMFGILLWCWGIFVESLADSQKLAFVRRYRSREERPFIYEGIWKYSQHPNFCGETTCWIGIFVLCWAGIPSHDLPVAAIAPIFSAAFLMQTTVPWLDVLADRKYGNEKRYRRYKQIVSSYWVLPQRPKWI